MHAVAVHGSGDVLPKGVPLRLTPAEGSLAMELMHRDFAAALDKRDRQRRRVSLRVRLAQGLRRVVARLDP